MYYIIVQDLVEEDAAQDKVEAADNEASKATTEAVEDEADAKIKSKLEKLEKIKMLRQKVIFFRELLKISIHLLLPCKMFYNPKPNVCFLFDSN